MFKLNFNTSSPNLYTTLNIEEPQNQTSSPNITPAENNSSSESTSLQSSHNNAMEQQLRRSIDNGVATLTIEERRTIARLDQTLQNIKLSILGKSSLFQIYDAHKKNLPPNYVPRIIKSINRAISGTDEGQNSFSVDNFRKFIKLIPHLQIDDYASNDNKVIGIRLGNAVCNEVFDDLSIDNRNRLTQTIAAMCNDRALDPTRARHKPNVNKEILRTWGNLIQKYPFLYMRQGP